MEHYAITLRPPVDSLTASTFPSSLIDIKPGCYRAVFTMLGGTAAGFIDVHWPGVTNSCDSRGDGSTIGCVYGSYDSDCYRGVLYLTNPEPFVQITYHKEDGTEDKTSIKQTVCVDLQRLC